MKTTNKFNLPKAIYNAVRNNQHEPSDENWISVTSLISPPLVRFLTRKYWDVLEEDASDNLWSLLGTAIHKVLQENAEEDVEVEKKVYLTLPNGWTLMGVVDVFNKTEHLIEDYKVTSVWSFLLGDKQEWENQLNVYAYMLRLQGYTIDKLQIHAILRDLQKSKTKNQGYPQIPFISKEIPLWSFEEQEKYVIERMKLFECEPRECTDEEKWKRGGEVALMQKGRKNALALYTKEQAQTIQISENQYWEDRPVEYIRCKEYCRVRSVCPFNIYKEEK